MLWQSPRQLGLSPNTETLTPQSFPFCLVTERVEVLPYALCLLLYLLALQKEGLNVFRSVPASTV